MARKSRKNVQATPAVVVDPVQYKVALYARISVENEQKREADTIGNQIALLKDFVSQHQDLVVFDLYCDDDISGVSFVRPEFARMMNDIRAGKVTCVIVKDLSRLGRNMIESGEYIEQIFPRMGVRFISVTDRFDSLRDDADISIQLKNFANEAYARDISKKIRAVKRTQQLAGKWTTGTPPYGYMLDPDDKYHLFPDPQTGPIVLAIFRMVAENHKMRSLPRDQWVIVPGTHEAIISEELFRTAQNALQGRIRNVNKNTAGNRANNLFVCGCCGRKLRKNPAKEPHLVCPKNDSIKGAECAGLFVNQTQIEQAVLQMLREQSRSFLEQHCLMQACIDKKLSSIQTELDANTNMTRRLQSRKAELYEQYRAGRISREKFADIQKTDSEKLARLSSRAEEIKRLLVEHYESRGNLAAGKRTADQIILLKDYDPEIIRNFVERVRVYPSGEIEIDMRTSSGFEFVTAS
jgi:DNA invertase Pin-like site-specific DNA recombinase